MCGSFLLNLHVFYVLPFILIYLHFYFIVGAYREGKEGPERRHLRLHGLLWPRRRDQQPTQVAQQACFCVGLLNGAGLNVYK